MFNPTEEKFRQNAVHSPAQHRYGLGMFVELGLVGCDRAEHCANLSSSVIHCAQQDVPRCASMFMV